MVVVSRVPVKSLSEVDTLWAENGSPDMSFGFVTFGRPLDSVCVHTHALISVKMKFESWHT